MSKDSWNGEVFNLERGNNYSINEVAAMFKPQEIKHVPARPGEAWTTLADLSFTQQKLGWVPSYNLPDYVDVFLETL
jgi:nucleoside-diphosphate-sugar epimerase